MMAYVKKIKCYEILLRCYLVLNVFIQTHKGKAEALCSCFRMVSGRMYSIERASCLMRYLASAAANLILKLQNIVTTLIRFYQCLHQLLTCNNSITTVSCSETNSETVLCKLLQKIHRGILLYTGIAETILFEYTQDWNSDK